MNEWDWTPYLVGGGTRPDAVTGLADPFEAALRNLYAAAPENVRQNLRITSGYRSPEVQQRLWDEALAKYGDPEIADNWVARPGKSNHNHGGAVDLKYLDPAAQEWVHANAANYGLHFPMSWEPWHIEMIDGAPVPVPNAPSNALAQSPQMAQAPQNALSQPLQFQTADITPYKMKGVNALSLQPLGGFA